MKRFLIIFASLVAVIFVALLVLPSFFKDDIRSAVDEELARSLNAQVYFDEGSFSVSVFRNFPNLTVSLDNFGLVGKDVFEPDTLLDVKEMALEVDLIKLINGEITLTGLTLNEPQIFILLLEDGSANYDIMVPSDAPETEEPEGTEESGEPMVIAIDHWKIINGTFIYYDIGGGIFMDLDGMNLTGGGDLTSERFDLVTDLSVDRVGFEYDEVQYLTGQSLVADVILDMNYSDYTFSFKENHIKLNDFGLYFGGFFGMPDEGYELDLTFASEESSFKSLLSLIPAVYGESFAELEAEGNVQFDGEVKGLYSFEDDGLPAFRVNFRVDEGKFQYPDLPSALEHVNLHVLADNADGVLDHTTVDVQTLSLALGTTGQVSGAAKITGFTTPQITANIKGGLDLQTLATVLPPEMLSGLDLAGILDFDVNANGTYDSENNQIPTFRANVNLNKGRVAYAEYPVPMEDIVLRANADNQSGKLDDTEILLERLHLNLDGEEVLVTGSLRNLADYTWRVSAKGGMDLAKLAGLLNLEETELSGKLAMDLTTEGKYSDLEAERYDRLPTNGTLTVTSFKYNSPDVPMPVGISKADLTFDPQKASIRQLDMVLGSSDLHLTGAVTNYLAYVMEENAVLQGNLNFTSQLLNLNELMASGETEDETETTEEDTTSSPMEVVVIPKTVDITLDSRISKVYYDNFELDNVVGDIVVRNGMVLLNGLRFRTLDGNFAVSGTYDTRNPEDPKVDLDLDIDEVSLKAAYSASGIVRRLAPVAQNMTGKFSTEFSLASSLEQDMMPKYATLTGAGLISIAQAAMDSGPLVSGLAETTKLGIKDNGVTMRDIVLSAKIENGRFSVRPFDVRMGTYKTTVSGSSGLDGSLDYLLNMEVPAGSAGQAFNSLVSNLTGDNSNAGSSTINLNVGLAGEYNKPKFTLRGTSASGATSTLANQVTDRAKQEVQETTQRVVEAGKDSVRAVADREAELAKEKLRQEAERAAEEAKNKVRDLFRRRGGGGGE